MSTDQINPEHYRRLDPEPIEVIESTGATYRAGQVIKYCARAGHKVGAPAQVDLDKALWYAKRAHADECGTWSADVYALLDAASQYRVSAPEVSARIVDTLMETLHPGRHSE